jgi:hypothetical protein
MTLPSRVYLALCFWHLALIQPYGRTLDTLGTLDKIAVLMEVINYDEKEI